MVPSGRDTLESPNREGSFSRFGSILIRPIVRIMYIMLNSIRIVHALKSEFRREPHAVDEPLRVFLISHLVFQVLDIGRQGYVTVDDKPVVGFRDL